MDGRFWEDYAADADSHYNEEFAKFIRDLAASLRCASVLEVGCNAGNDLRLFSGTTEVHGLDIGQKIVDIARQRLASFDFRTGSAVDMPYADASVDIVFTHGFFNYLDDGQVDAALAEMFRVSKRYIVNCELGCDGPDSRSRGRDMYQKWLSYKVRIISNVEMHEDIDPAKPRFVLVKKI